MPTEIDPRRLLASAVDHHTSGTFLVVCRITAPCGEAFAPEMEVMRDPSSGDVLGGDPLNCLKATQVALTHPVGGVLTILKDSGTWEAWCWQLLAGSAIPMDEQQTEHYVRTVLKFRRRDGEGMAVQPHAGYPIQVLTD